MVEIQKMTWIISKINKYHIRKQPIIENPHNQSFKQEKKGSYEDFYIFKFLAY